MPPTDRSSFLFPIAEKLVPLVREYHSDEPMRMERRLQLGAQIRALLLDYSHAEALWLIATSDESPAPPATKPGRKSHKRRFANHPWYGYARKPK